MNWFKKHWLILIILTIALALRLYRIGATMTFLEDEGRDLLIVKRMLDTGRPVLIGPQTSTGSMYLGPLYYYLITPSLYLSQLNPVGPAVMIALSGVLTTYLMFYLGKMWFSRGAGYWAALLFATLPFSVAVTRASWNPNLIPLISALMLIIFDRLVYKKGSLLDWFFYGILVGTMVQLHYMALVFLGVLSLTITWYKRKDLRSFSKGVVVSLLGFICILSPFIFFEYRNDWVNTRAITRFMEAKQDRNIRYDLPLWLWWDKVGGTSYRLIGDTLVGSELGNQTPAPVAVWSYLALATLSLGLALKKRQKKVITVSVILVASLTILGIYQENIHMHYLEFGIPLIILVLAAALREEGKLWMKWAGFAVISLCLAYGLPHTIGFIASGSTHQVEKAQAVANYIVEKAAGRKYNLISAAETNTSPYQYFAYISANPPVNSAQQTVFMVCQDQECSQDDISSPLIFIHGPSHPSLSEYVGHPLAAYAPEPREVISNEHVSYGIWVAELVLK